MTQQVPIDPRSVAAIEADDGALEAAPDVAYLRLVFVNVVYVRQPGQPDWVLVDIGLPGTAYSIAGVTTDRFGVDVPPRAIVLTHGHFDHVGALATLAERWNVPIYAHKLERPYLNGSASYPKADPSVGGGMALLSPLYPQSPVNVGRWRRDLPADANFPEFLSWRWIHPGPLRRPRVVVARDRPYATCRKRLRHRCRRERIRHGHAGAGGTCLHLKRHALGGQRRPS